MGVRPPQQGSDTPDTIEFGIAALAPRLDAADIEFPATTDEIVRSLDDTDVPYDATGRTVALGDALNKVPKDQFKSKSEVLDRLHPVFEEYRASASRSILGQLRDLLPI